MSDQPTGPDEHDARRDERAKDPRVEGRGGVPDEHRNGPDSQAGETERGRTNLRRRARQYFSRPENIISLLTLVAVLVYTSLTYGLLNAERESYTRVQRAFVFPSEHVLRLDAARQSIGINTVWTNGGGTPTRNLRISITAGLRSTPLPSDFDFPTDDQQTHGGHPLPILVLGPHGTVSAVRRADIPLGAIADINSGKALLYLWGYARYDDVFGSPHVTRYCVQMTSIETDPAGSASGVAETHVPCDRGNCADEECAAETIPLPR